MLEEIGVASIDELFSTLPKKACKGHDFQLALHKGELEVERLLSAYAQANVNAHDGPFFLGGGCYFRHVPATVDAVIQRSEFLTAYTPYQPEIAQGTLQVIFEFQTFITQLTGQEVANASLYDGATATAEAVLMAMRLTKRQKVAIASCMHPHYRATLETYLKGDGLFEGKPDSETACVVLSVPNFYGETQEYQQWRKVCDETGALLVVVISDVLSLGLLPSPECADIVCGEGQGIGLSMNFGGPHLGFFACKEKYLRQMPGRLCGMSEDVEGRRSFVLTLSTREQHIRREKATSNICTNQGLCALAFCVHMALLGEDGFTKLARLNHEAACRTADALAKIPGVVIETKNFFNEFVVQLPIKDSKALVSALAKKKIIAGYPLDNGRLLVAATEMTKDEHIHALATAIKESL